MCFSLSFRLFLFSLILSICWKFSYDTTDRSIFDESGIGYTDSHIDNRIECTELVNSGKAYVQMKSEPAGGASSPESSADIGGGPDDCAGCGRLIQVNEQADSHSQAYMHTHILTKKSISMIRSIPNWHFVKKCMLFSLVHFLDVHTFMILFPPN